MSIRSLPLSKDARITIAVVRFSAFGDVTLLSGAIHCLRDYFHNARIIWITSPSAYQLLKGMEGIEFIKLNKINTIKNFFIARKQLSKLKVDVLLAFQASFSVNLVYSLIKSTFKLGYDFKRARDLQFLFTNKKIESAEEHILDGFLSFLRVLGVPNPHPIWNFNIQEEDVKQVSELLNTSRKSVVIHPVSSKIERTWFKKNYIDLVKEVKKKYNVDIILTGGLAESEKQFIKEIIERSRVDCINACGLSFHQMLIIYQNSAAIIAPDTAAVHLGVAVGTPVIGLYAVASSALSGPYDTLQYTIDRHPEALKKFKMISHKTNIHTRVHTREAMNLISVADVLEKLDLIFHD